MRFYALLFALAAVVTVECGHTFIGTNILRPLVFHKNVRYPSHILQKRVEYLRYELPPLRQYSGGRIQGILAYDLTHSGATVNVTEGGVGFNHITLWMKGDLGRELNYDVYIYA